MAFICSWASRLLDHRHCPPYTIHTHTQHPHSYPVESRPSLDIDSSMVSSTSSTYLPSLATSPRHASGLFRRRSSSRLLTLPQQQDGQQQQPPLAATGPARESDYLLGGQRPKEPKERRASLGGALPTAAAAAAAGGGGAATAGPGVTTTSTIVGVELERGQGEEGEEPPLTWAERACDGLLGCCDGTWQVLRRMGANPSIRAAMAAFALGLVPPLKALFVGGDGEGVNDPPLGAFTGAIEILGSAQVPCSMLMLSGSGTIRYLNDRAAKSEVQQPFAFSPKTVLCIIAGRVLLFPLLGLGWWWAGFELGLFQSVPILSLVVLLDAAVPTAQNIVMLILVHGKPEHGHVRFFGLLGLCFGVGLVGGGGNRGRDGLADLRASVSYTPHHQNTPKTGAGLRAPVAVRALHPRAHP